MACVALGGAGCAKRETPVQAGIRTQTLHFGNVAEPANLDPQTYTMLAESTILSSLFEGLVNLANDGATILPGVAERWEISADGLLYTFHLRDNARWSNGEAITANDFVTSFRRLLNPAIGSPSSEYAFPIQRAQDYFARRCDFDSVGVRALNPRTLQFTLGCRTPYFLTLVSNATSLGMPIHAASVEKFAGFERRDGKWTLPGNLVGNGSFVLHEWRPNQFIVVKRNEHYWDAARVRLKEIRFYPAEDDAVEERAYRSGQLHATSRLPQTKLAAYRAAKDGGFQQAAVLETEFLSFNCARPPFSDARVRRALSLAIDRPRAVDAAFRDRAQPAISFTRPGTGGFEPRVLHRCDPAEAQRLLAAAGYPGGRGFPHVELRIIAGRPDVTALAETLQQMWKQALGIDVALAQMETKTLLASLQAHDFQIGLSGYYYYDDPSDVLALGGKDCVNNYAGWHDPRYEAARVDVLTAKTDADRLAAFARMEAMIAEEAPYAPLFHFNLARLVHPSVRGWRENRFRQVDWRELWLEPPRTVASP